MAATHISGETPLENSENNFEVFRHPDEIAEIFTGLYSGPKRANEIPKWIDNVSEPTVYSILKELEEKGFIRKIKKSRRHVFLDTSPFSIPAPLTRCDTLRFQDTSSY